jgi:excisionase family DNA binding protein
MFARMRHRPLERTMNRLTTSVAEARKSLGIGHTKLYELINSGDLKTIRIGRRRLIIVDSIERLVADRAT